MSAQFERPYPVLVRTLTDSPTSHTREYRSGSEPGVALLRPLCLLVLLIWSPFIAWAVWGAMS